MWSILPKERIAKAGEERVFRRLENGSLSFFPRAKFGIGRGSEALHFAEIVGAVSKRGTVGRGRFNTGVNNRSCAAVIDGAAGKTAVGIVPAGSRR